MNILLNLVLPGRLLQSESIGIQLPLLQANCPVGHASRRQIASFSSLLSKQSLRPLHFKSDEIQRKLSHLN